MKTIYEVFEGAGEKGGPGARGAVFVSFAYQEIKSGPWSFGSKEMFELEPIVGHKDIDYLALQIAKDNGFFRVTILNWRRHE